MKDFVKQIVEAYKSDPSAASLVISFLPTGNYYGSIIRYKKAFGGDKEVVAKFQHPLFESMLAGLYNAWTGEDHKFSWGLSNREIKLMQIIRVKSELFSLDELIQMDDMFSREEAKIIGGQSDNT